MAVSDGETIFIDKDMGLVSNVFNDRRLAALSGHLAAGHTRYSTTGSSTWRNAQPVYRNVGDVQFALAHNGNLVNTGRLADEAGMLPGMVASDSDLVAELLAQRLVEAGERGDGRDLEYALVDQLPRFEGAFSFVIVDEGHLIGVRDPNGFRPLCLGKLEGGWVLASESPALDTIGAHFVREIEPGEMVVIDASGCRSYHFSQDRIDPRLCVRTSPAMREKPCSGAVSGSAPSGRWKQTGCVSGTRSPGRLRQNRCTWWCCSPGRTTGTSRDAVCTTGAM